MAPAEVPDGVVTVTVTAPVVSLGGLKTVISVALSDTMLAAAPPKLTLVAPDRLLPTMVTSVLPAVEPLFGRRPVIAGGGLTLGERGGRRRARGRGDGHRHGVAGDSSRADRSGVARGAAAAAGLVTVISVALSEVIVAAGCRSARPSRRPGRCR